MWYDISKTLSYNALFNFVIGARGVGKTYAFKRWAIKDFLKNKKQFVYIRRYKTEVSGRILKNFFADIAAEFPGVKLDVKGQQFFINDKLAGQAIPLSTAKVHKSVPFPEVNKICFDEFILDKGSYHYLPDEVVNFLELYSTIARLRDVPVIFISNALTITNPYFLYFKVVLPFGNKTVARTGNEIIVEMVRDTEYSEAASNTRFGSIICDTPYGNYNIENEFLRDNKNFVAKKTPGSTYYFTLRAFGKNYGIWVDYKEGLITASNDVDPSCKLVYAVTTDDHSPNTLLLKGTKSVFLSTLGTMFREGCVRYESVAVKNELAPAMKLLC